MKDLIKMQKILAKAKESNLKIQKLTQKALQDDKSVNTKDL